MLSLTGIMYTTPPIASHLPKWMRECLRLGFVYLVTAKTLSEVYSNL